MFPSNWYQHRWEPDYKVFQSYDPTIFVHRNNCSNFILKPYCRKITDLVNLNFCSLVTCAPKESHNVKGVAALPFFGFPPLCYSRRMKAWLPFSGFRPLFYAFGILSPFVILGVVSSPLLFLEDKDCLPFFIGLKKVSSSSKGYTWYAESCFPGSKWRLPWPAIWKTGQWRSAPPLDVWPLQPQLGYLANWASPPSQPLSPEFCNSKQNLTPQSCLACIMVDHYPIWGTERQNKSGNKVTLPLCPNFQGWLI